jgi:hypothetical protein
VAAEDALQSRVSILQCRLHPVVLVHCSSRVMFGVMPVGSLPDAVFSLPGIVDGAPHKPFDFLQLRSVNSHPNTPHAYPKMLEASFAYAFAFVPPLHARESPAERRAFCSATYKVRHACGLVTARRQRTRFVPDFLDAMEDVSFC